MVGPSEYVEASEERTESARGRGWDEAGKANTVLVAAIVAGVAVLFWQLRVIAPVVLPQGVTRWNQDLYTIYYPLYAFAYRGSNLLPLWNPHQLVGVPFLANYNGGLLYPPNLLATVVPVHLALGYLCAFHLALAGLFAFLAAQALALSASAAALCAAGFMLSGYLVSEAIHPSYLAALAWIPAVFLCAGRLVSRARAIDSLVLGGALTFQFLTGQAQAVCYCVYALLVVTPVYLAQLGWRPRELGRLAVLVLLAIVTALLLSAIQLAPTVEVVARGVRSFQRLTLAQTLPGTPSLERLHEAVSSTGLLVLLAVFALGAHRRRTLVVAALVLMVFSALVGLGTRLYTDFFYFLPGVGLFRLPQAMLNVSAFALAILAGVGLDAAVRAREDWSATRQVALLALAVAVLMIARPRAISLPLGGAVLASVAVLLWLQSSRTRVAVSWLIVTLVVAERFVQPGNRSMMPQNNDEAFFAPPPVVRFVAQRAGHDRVLVMKNWKKRFPLTEKMGTLYGLNMVQDYEPLAPASVHEFLRPLEFSNVDQPLFWGRFYPPPTTPAWALLDMMAVRYVIVEDGAPWAGDVAGRFRLVYPGPDARVYENLESLPRAYLVPQYDVVISETAALAAVHSRSFDPRRAAVVDRAVEPAPAGAGGPGVDEVRFDRLDNDAVVMEVDAARPGLLVLSDLYWPGWRVTVDEEERPIYRANYLFRGVVIDTGRHTVRFWYDPPAFRLGAAVSVVTAMVLVSVLGWGATRRRRAT